jgi:hypothetical protein
MIRKLLQKSLSKGPYIVNIGRCYESFKDIRSSGNFRLLGM